MKGSGTVTIREKSGMTHEFSFRDEWGFRLLYLDDEGIWRVKGKMPLKKTRKRLREWAREWATKQDIIETESFFRRTITDWVAQHDDVDCAIIGHISLETILETIVGMRDQAKEFFRLEYGSRDGIFVCHIIMEMLKALACRLKTEGAKPQTEWDFPEIPVAGQDWDSIRDWLFRGR